MIEFLNPLISLFQNNLLAALLFGLISVFIPLFFNYLGFKSKLKPLAKESNELENKISNLPNS